MFWSSPPRAGRCRRSRSADALLAVSGRASRHCFTSAVAASSSSGGLARIGRPGPCCASPSRSPYAKLAERRHPEVVAGERHRAVVELLVVRVRRDVGQPSVAASRSSPRSADVVPYTSSDGTVVPVGAVADRPRRRVARVVAAVPPDRVQHAAVRRDVREDLVPAGLVVDQRRRRERAGRPVVADEVMSPPGRLRRGRPCRTSSRSAPRCRAWSRRRRCRPTRAPRRIWSAVERTWVSRRKNV